jgi:uncharacterized protein YkwD
MYKKYDFITFSKADFANKSIDVSNIDYPLLNAALFYATNLQREKFNLAVLTHQPVLEKAASGHSFDMVNYGFFSHTSLVSGKKNFSDRIELAGEIEAWASAENIAQNFILDYNTGKSYQCPKTKGGNFTYTNGQIIKVHSYWTLAEMILRQWMNSQGHRENILDNSYTHLGCGAAVEKVTAPCSFEKVFCTQNFAKIDK